MDALTLIPPAYADSCLPVTYSACNAGVRTATFNGCTVGAVAVDGSVNLTFSDTAACNIATVGDSVNRTGSLTLSALGGSLAITTPGGGQTLTRTAGGFTFAVPGMERVLTLPSGRTLFDISTMTSTPLTITGSSRADMVMVGGTLVVTHNLAGYSVALTPDNLAWTPTCNCASSGSLTGTVSGGGKDDGKSATVTITGCGTADVTVDGDTESVTMDRCAAIRTCRSFSRRRGRLKARRWIRAARRKVRRSRRCRSRSSPPGERRSTGRADRRGRRSS